nr:hypothetical protein [Enterococcus innesii]
MKKSFVRERRVEAGPYKEIRLYSRTIEQERKCREPRGRRKKLLAYLKQDGIKPKVKERPHCSYMQTLERKITMPRSLIPISFYLKSLLMPSVIKKTL